VRRHAVLSIMAGALAAASVLAAPRGGDAVSGDGRSLWRLEPSGVLSRVKLPDGDVERFAGSLPPLTSLAGPVDGRLYAISPRPDKGTWLLALSASSLEVESRWELRGDGRFLEITPDGSTACVILLRGDDWNLVFADLRRPDAAARVLALPSEPQAVTMMPDADSPAGSRLVVAFSGRLSTFQISPPAPSWFYKSPGDHRAVRPLPADKALVALRDRAVAVFDPALRPREEGGRVRLTEDDATGVVPLPSAGDDLAVAAEGKVVAVLHDGGTQISWVDVEGGRVFETRPLDGAHRMVERSDGVALVGESDAGGRAPVKTLTVPDIPPPPPETSADTRKEEVPKEAAPVPVAEPRKPPEPEKPADKPKEAAVVPAPEPRKPPEPEKPVEKPKDAGAVPVPEHHTSPEKTPPPSTAPQPPPQAGPAPASPVAEPRASSLAFLSGRVNGTLPAAAEVRLYGPGNILKLQARIPLDRDGSFRLPLPPPGTYRILISPGSGTYLFTRPEYRTIVVAPAGGGLDGIDFEVRGAL
jgi:hypothetical protein